MAPRSPDRVASGSPSDLVKMRPDPAMPPACIVAAALPNRAPLLGHYHSRSAWIDKLLEPGAS